METKFTKGKWSIYIGADNLNAITVCKVSASTSIISERYVDGDLECDANLIASAPDMYAMLDVLSTDSQVMFGEKSKVITSDISKLLAKARGESI